jgi:hypothetical protein
MSKKERGQFYTVNHDYILEGMTIPAGRIVEPFAGRGDLITWLRNQGIERPVEAYDIEPKMDGVIYRDTLLDPPNYEDAWILTNPPYLARNKCDKKEIFDLYGVNDLYKCFLETIQKCAGGIIIIPAGFFFSTDSECRNTFMTNFRILKVKYFEETVFPDTSTTVVAIAFEAAGSPLVEQEVEWNRLPSKEKHTFRVSAEYDWIIGGDIYKLPVPPGIRISRHVEGQALKPGEQQTWLTLNALDSGLEGGRIKLEYKEGYVYPGISTSRTYATLRIRGLTLSEEMQTSLCIRFNSLLEQKRKETWSLFLPQFRESKDYARKRIPFDLAYRIVLYLLSV